MDPLFDPLQITPEQWLSMSEEEFATRFAQTPLTRSGLERIQRNVRQNLEEKNKKNGGLLKSSVFLITRTAIYFLLLAVSLAIVSLAVATFDPAVTLPSASIACGACDWAL